MDKGYKDIEGFAKIDTDRSSRTGFPETVFCQGKTSAEIAKIMLELSSSGKNVFGTRANLENYRAVKELLPEAEFFESAGIIAYWPDKVPKTSGYIAVITAGTADIPAAEEAALTAELLGNRVERIYDVGVSGIHRLFDELPRIRGARAIIVAAGMEGALASVVGGLVSVPVIALPTSIGYGASFGGLAALLSMLNSCANGVSVVNIDNGYGAGYNAALIMRMGEKE